MKKQNWYLSVRTLTLVVLAWFASPAWAQLSIQGDLVLHPSQLANFFALDTASLNSTPSMPLQSMTFTSPYKSTWNQVTAQGPFNIQFDTSSLATQDLGFTVTWANPSLTVGTFNLTDTIQTTVGGINVTLNVAEMCTGMTIVVPSGNWVMQGKMHYDMSSGNILGTVESFQLTMGANVTPQVNMGQCSGLQTALPTIQSSIAAAAVNQSLIQSLLQPAVTNWMQSELGTLQTQLLGPRNSQVESGLTMTWQPSALSNLSGGLVRIAGALVLAKIGSTVGAGTVVRNYDPSILNAVTTSTLILPHNTLQQVLNYMFSNGELTERIASSSIAAFQTLEQSRFDQFFVWPDLMSFLEKTLFYFDFTTSSAPQLGSGWIQGAGGSAYQFTAPMLVHQWAPSNGTYVPYVDFRAPLSGTLSAVINNGNLNLQMNIGSTMNLTDSFRPEFAKVRSENTYIDTSTIASDSVPYLNSTPFSVAIPNFAITPAVSMQMTDVQVWNETLRIPLTFVAP